ncbi:hypothetical protein D3C72_1553980 [compost metagenome]
MAVGVHVVGIDIGDHRHHGQQVQERCVRLVGLDHDVLAAAQSRIGTCTVELAANHKGRVPARFGQHARDQAGGGGLAMGSGNGDALAQAHQLCQHLRARHHRNVPGACGQHLGVVGLHRRRGDHSLRVGDMCRIVADKGGDACIAQVLQGGAVGQIRTRHHIAQVVQHFGNAAHAGATDTHEVNALDGVLHRATSSQA